MINDFNSAGLSKKQLSLCEFAQRLTLKPDIIHEGAMIEKLRENGLTDNAILDATLVVAYFNFVNRIVLSLGVESDDNELKGYNF